ncbi:hypothetical protein WH47_05346 [Habropoda laboriosa]|uniref:Uncharacterized protein n=1 Tax=Habropoda laboriosa TaxID=597456 RepID=A0A0L7QTG2_9HYME|nr:hypothetical protein WH47_05346 [Habropoda laboriosa]
MLARQNIRYISNYKFPSTKLRNVFCLQCKRQFFFQGRSFASSVSEFVPLHGVVPLLLDCGHVICDKCAKSFANKPCPTCNVISQYEDDTPSLPLNIYALGLIIVSNNRPINTDDSHISFAKSVNSKVKEQHIKDLCYECGIPATVKCPQCNALYCSICYSKIHGRALQNHSKIVLSESNYESLFTIPSSCSDWCNEPLGYYCENCNIAGCSHCILRLHQKHNYQPLIQKNQEFVHDFYSAFDQVSQNLQRVQQSEKVSLS